MNAPTGLALNAFFSQGDWDGYCNVKWTAVDLINVYYRIEYHLLSTGQWVWVGDVPWEASFTGTSIRFATAAPNGPKTRIVDQIRITSTDIAGVSPPASATITTPTSLATSHIPASNLSRVCYGDVGDLRGQCNVRWDDLTKFVSSGRIVVTKRGLTSPDIDRVLYDNSFTSTPTSLGPNFLYFLFDLFPPGIPLADPPVWDPFNPPVTDPRAPFWIVEGDVLTLVLTTYVDDDPTPTVSTFSFTYGHVPRFYQFAEAATRNQAYSHNMDVIQDPWIPIPLTGVFTAPHGGMPPGLTISSSGLISGTPTTAGVYRPVINCVGPGGGGSEAAIQLVVNLVNPPVIMAPPGIAPLVFGTPYPPQFNIYATNHPSSYAISSGTLPVGLSLNTATGVISGTPTAIEAPHIVNFTATNAAGTSAPWPVTYSVEYIAPPTINSPNTLAVFYNELANYQILTNLPALFYRGFDLPSGLALVGGVLTGMPTDPIGVYHCQLQAINQWGWGPLFALQVTIGVRAPEIFSPLLITANLNEPFTYSIFGSNNPITFGATGLPNGLSINTATGVISGAPTVVGNFEILLMAINAGGAGQAVLILDVQAPPIPVIDTSATHGRAITVEAFTPFVFQPAASNHPDIWSADPLPDGLSLDVLTGRMSGQFQAPGLLGVVFIATNAGGPSDPATFFFLVSIPSQAAAELNLLATSTEIWIDILTGTVTIGSAAATAGATFTVKRGDTVQPTVIFHDSGVTADLIVTTLKFGAKVKVDDDYVLFTDSFRKTGPGTYRIYPDFSPDNNALDGLLVEDKLVLIGEVQWDELDSKIGTTIRRSTPVFPVTVLRDIVHPD